MRTDNGISNEGRPRAARNGAVKLPSHAAL